VHTLLQTEQDILKGLAAGNRAATEEIYKQHHKTIVKWVLNNGGDVSDAEDVFQEGMVILFEKAQSDSFRLTCKVGTYLIAVSKNLWYQRMQQRRKDPVLLPENEDGESGIHRVYEEDISTHHEREVYYEQLNDALEQLGEPCRSLLTAFYHQDKNMQEITTLFGYTNADNAKTQKYKCLTRLRKLFYGVQAKTT
jgi:RNA polymerase sigma factor (sigma-70 family)